jgi:hypothetical protein
MDDEELLAFDALNRQVFIKGNNNNNNVSLT